MSDFLGNLVARTMAQPTLRPRTRSRFETSAIEETPLVWPEATNLAEPDVASQTAPPPTTTNKPTRTERRRPAGWPGGVSPPRPEAETRSESTPAQAEAPKPAEQKRVLIEHDTQRIVETIERIVPVPIPVATLPHRFEEQPPQIIERNGPREIEERLRERIIHTNTDRTRRIAGPPQQIEGTSSAEPIIQVSIGRIEVRAVPSAASPTRGAARSATMTIDDYVARRKARERR